MTVAKTDRRTIIGAGALIAGAGLLASTASAQTPSQGRWTPAREEKDDWMDIPGTRHRMVYDTTSAKAFAQALFYAGNYYQANESGYGLKPETLGVIIIARHMSTPLAYHDAVWAKYGAAFTKLMELTGDEAERAKTRNPMLSAKDGQDGGATVSALTAKGARLAVCGMATQFIAGMLAKEAGVSAKALEEELGASLVPNGVMVPAGIVAVNRAQEHGYAFAYVA